MIYTYRCTWTDTQALFGAPFVHTIEEQYPIGKAPGFIVCKQHGTDAPRDLIGDVLSQTVDQYGSDSFRRYDMSSQRTKAEAQQQRRIEGPKDRSEARAIEAATGRKYIGNNTDSLTPKEQRALDRHGYGKVT